MFVTLKKYFWQSCYQNKVKGENCKLAAFEVNSRQLSKVNYLSQYWQNSNIAEVRVK